MIAVIRVVDVLMPASWCRAITSELNGFVACSNSCVCVPVLIVQCVHVGAGRF